MRNTKTRFAKDVDPEQVYLGECVVIKAIYELTLNSSDESEYFNNQCIVARIPRCDETYGKISVSDVAGIAYSLNKKGLIDLVKVMLNSKKIPHYYGYRANLEKKSEIELMIESCQK
jgi:hypothetical protein